MSARNPYFSSPKGKFFPSQSEFEQLERPSTSYKAVDKVRQLYDFMDTVEGRADALKSAHNFIENELQSIEANETSTMQAYSEGRSTFLNLKIELEETQKSNELLKKMLEKEKTRSKDLEDRLKKEKEEKLQQQKEEYEETIQKQLTFIDQIISDKKELGEQCELLLNQVQDNENKYIKQISDLKEKYQRELKSSKEVWAAGEKQRREKWLKEKTAEIKEITIKGLEPEIDRIMNKGKEDIKKTEDKYRGEISNLREELHWEYEEKLKVYKEKTFRECEEKIEKEREYMELKKKQYTENLEYTLIEEKEKIKTFFETKIQQIEKERHTEILQLKDKIRKLESSKKNPNSGV